MGLEITRELPPGPEQDLDCEVFERLLRAAIARALDDLRSVSPPERLWVIYGGNPEDARAIEPRGPSYWEQEVWDRVAQTWNSPQFLELADYIWERGRLKKSLTGPDPGKEAWARFVYADLIQQPLLTALEESDRERLTDGQPAAPWVVDPQWLAWMVEEIVNVYCRGQVTLVVSTPLLGLRGPSGASYPLATDIVLKILSPREQHLFMSRHHREFLWDDFKIPLVHSGLAEVRLPVKKGEGGSRAERVELVWGRLDVLKWALFICQNRDIPLVEGTNVWQGVLGRRDVRSHRDANLFGRDHDINEDITRSAAELIDSFRRAVDRADELQRALWHFGRSSVATLPRDILLEAAIGLEALLVPGPGESGYRFSLHGAVIIAGGTPRAEEIRRQLGEIYGSRSGAAHGGARAVVEGLAILARRLLAEALEQTTRLVLGGAIDVSERLPVAIQRYVFQRATR